MTTCVAPQDAPRGTQMVTAGTNAVVHAVVGMLALPLIFKLFKTPFAWPDIALACVAGALLTLVPTMGEVLSFLAMVLVLNYRMSASLTSIVIPVMVTRLLMMPVLLVFALHA